LAAAASDDDSDAGGGSSGLLEFKYAAISIMFDVKNYTKNIPKVQLDAVGAFLKNIDSKGRAFDADMGKLMEAIDLSNRWIYKGSKTHPPCD